MSLHLTMRGARPVGHVGDLGEIEARAVTCLRLWQSDPQTQNGLRNDLAARLGPQAADATIAALETLFDLCARHARRPLICHAADCDCLGAGEACFANFIATAASGSREDALLIATLIIRVDMAPVLAGLAEQIGLAFARAARRPASARLLH
jgi:hypothetical protein